MAAPTPLPRPPFPLREGERLLAQSPGASFHWLGATGGVLWLTSERVVFWPVVPILFWIALPLGLGLWAMNRPRRREIELSRLTAVERTSFGRNPNVMVLVTGDLSRDLKVFVETLDAFAAALAAARRAARAALPDPSTP